MADGLVRAGARRLPAADQEGWWAVSDLFPAMPSDASLTLDRARRKLERIRERLDAAYGTASEADFITILECLGEAYRDVHRLEREAIR
jgi:hypothetical protein